MTRAQTVFVIALSVIAVLIGVFAVYVAGSTMWANRWYERGPKRSGGPRRPRGAAQGRRARK